MAKSEKCKHPSCVCLVGDDDDFGGYCSAHWQDAEDLAELRCECGHGACLADAEGRTTTE